MNKYIWKCLITISLFNNLLRKRQEQLQNIQETRWTQNSMKKTIREIIENYRSHPSIIKIKEIVKERPIFGFPEATTEDINKIIKSLNPSRATGLGRIMVNGFSKIYEKFLHEGLSNFADRHFPNLFQLIEFLIVQIMFLQNLSKNGRNLQMTKILLDLYLCTCLKRLIAFPMICLLQNFMLMVFLWMQ